MSTAHDLMLREQELGHQLNMERSRLDAMAGLLGENYPKFLIGAAVPVVAMAAGVGGAYLEAQYDSKGAIANAVIAAGCWVGGMMMPDNPDVRNFLYGIAGGLGTAAGGIAMYNWAKDRKVQAAVAPAAAAPAAA